MYTQKINYGMTEEYFGLSTDTKPTQADNGDLLTEIDTGKKFRFDEQNGTWYEQPSGGSGGGSGGGDDGGSDGGSSGGDFIVTVMERSVYDEETEQSYTDYEFDKTADEAIEAFNAGATVKFKHLYESEDDQGQTTLKIREIITALYHDTSGSGISRFYGFYFSYHPYEYHSVSSIRSYGYYYDESSGAKVFQGISD